YDIEVFSPKGHPDMVYVLGSFQYGERGRTSNSRGVLLSTTAGDPDRAHGDRTFTDVSWSAGTPPDGIHPDQHAIVVSPEDPNVFFEGSDGGLMRSDGRWVDISAQCDTRRLTASSLVACKRLLSRVPNKLTSLNFGLSTMQFQGVSISHQRPFEILMGGTQDNGTLTFFGLPLVWPATINGDGGLSGFDAASDRIRFHSYFGPQVDITYRGAEPTGWSWISDPFFAFPENFRFYVPIAGD